ncbi:hypothetical protein TSUD_410640 [Trifolium subterraneum]|uniref:Replication factor A C-terminal domain-containing protein n=1 Tax=Trifolium subterraneum TaxID=3900 RepID=A0A2Z6PUK0_TRISU|nr:hypothetical protein TSUD_410640 [Trifolium subterraneum]
MDAAKPGHIASADMVLLDKNDHKIQASIPAILLPSFNERISEGYVYQMSMFSVKHNLIGSVNLKKLSGGFQYLVDVIGVLTYISYEKTSFDNGNITKSVTFDLTDHKGSYQCELSGKFVDLFRDMLENQCVGLPIILLQFAKITKSQGKTIVHGVDDITRIFVNHEFAEAINFRIGFDSSFKTISQIRTNPQLGIYVISDRMIDITHLDPWWYPICQCNLIVESYLGEFCCDECGVTDFLIVPKYRVRIVIEDQSGSIFLDSYDDVMFSIDVNDPTDSGVCDSFFPRAFDSVMGKSMMFIVHKTKHDSHYSDSSFELLRLSADRNLIEFHRNKGVNITPSKTMLKKVDKDCNLMVHKDFNSPFTNTDDFLDEYLWSYFVNPCSRDDP